jgi:hypothetical protein
MIGGVHAHEYLAAWDGEFPQSLPRRKYRKLL